MTIVTEGGLWPSRVEWVAEPSQGVIPTAPNWNIPSERVTDFDPGLSLNWSENSSLGEVDYDRETTTEESELSMTYALQRWFFDADGAIQDLAGYGLVRASSNRLPSSVSVVRRVQSGDVEDQYGGGVLDPASTVDARENPESAADGSDSDGKLSRLYDVLKGVDVGEAALSAERESSAWEASLTCPAEYGRSFQIDQPPTATDVLVWSTNSNDTEYQVKIESEGATTTTTVTLDASDATVPKSTSDQFSDIDAITIMDPNGNRVSNLDNSYMGDIVVAINDGGSTETTKGDWLSVFSGVETYGSTYGDPGVPTLGADGSHASPISASGEKPTFYKPQNMRVERPVGSAVEYAGGVLSTELTVSNNAERTADSGREMTTMHGMRGVEYAMTCDGETISTYMAREMMRGTEKTTRVIFNAAGDEYIDLTDAPVTEAPRGDSAGSNSAEREFSLLAQRGADSEPAIDISPAGSGKAADGTSGSGSGTTA